jgi:hypothetical protein
MKTSLVKNMPYRVLVILLLQTVTACGVAQYGDKTNCESNFSATQAKVNSLQPSSSTKTAMISTLGEPNAVYATSDTTVKDYRFYVYANAKASTGYCGQFKIDVYESNNQIGQIEVYKTYLYQ